MARKKPDESGAPSKSKPTGKDAAKDGKKEKLSVSAMLASMDQKPAKKGSSSSGSSSNKPKSKVAAKPSYIDGIDLPPSDEEDDDYASEDEQQERENLSQQQRSEAKALDISVTDKELKKREKKDMLVAQAAAIAKQEALRDDRDAFTVVIGSRASVLDGENEADANVKDITIDNFSVSARGKELFKNASVKISHGKRYGLVGPNGMGKSTLLKLLAWRKIPVPKNIDVLLVEQEVIGDDKTALEAVVSANEELVKLRQEVAALQDAPSAAGAEDGNDDGNEDDAGEKLAELYERLQLIGSDAAEAQASKILAGLGFTKDMQGRPTKSFSGGWRMRISLARALFVQPTLLLLDEPTNHLDLRAVLWLEEYLCRWKKTLVVVSHDRDFLNTVCNEIIHLHDLKLHVYRGNFDDFESGYEQRRKEMNKKYEIFEKQMKAAKRSGNRVQQEKVKDRAKAISSPLFQFPTAKHVSLSSFTVSASAAKKKVVIVNTNSGGHAVIGFYLAKELLGSGHEVTIMTVGEESSDKMKKPPFTRFSEIVSAGGRTVWGDPADIGKVLEGAAFDVVLDNNGKDLDAVRPVADWAKSSGVKYFFFISSAGIYKPTEEPPHVEGDEVKADAGHVGVEKYISENFNGWVSFRPQYMVGSGNNKDCEEWFFDRIVRGRPVPIPGSGMQLVNISHVRDLSSMLTLAIENPDAASGNIFNLVSDRAVTLDGMARLCAQAAGSPLEIVHFDPKAVGVDARKAFPFRNMHFYAEPRAAKDILGWKSTTNLPEDLKERFEEYVKIGRDKKPMQFEIDDKILESLKVPAAV